MPARIVLVRHGPSAHVHRGGMIDRDGMFAWRAAYDAAGILADAGPPRPLVELAGQASHVVSSDLRRAIESAERLSGGRELHVSSLLRESPLPVPAWPTRLRLGMWGTIIYAAWAYRIFRRTDPAESEKVRAAEAASWLVSLVSEGSTAVVVTHGVFRRLIANELAARGWTGRRDGGYRHWSAWSFISP